MPTRRISFRSRHLTGCVLLILTISTTGCSLMSGRWSNQNGLSAYRRGNYHVAQREFTRAVYDDPDNPDYLSNLATVSKKQGQMERAERLYQTALRVDPSHQPSYHGLASLMKDSGRQEEAYSLIEGWQATQPYRVGPHLEMAWLKRETGDTAGTEIALKRALQVQPNNSTALAHLGQVYQDRGQPTEAMAMYRRSLQTNWSQPEVRSRLASLQRTQPAAGPVSRFAQSNGFVGQAANTLTAMRPPSPIAVTQSDWTPVPSSAQPVMTTQETVLSSSTVPPNLTQPVLFQPPIVQGGNQVSEQVVVGHSGSFQGPVTTVSAPQTEPASPGPQLLVPIAGEIPADIVEADTVSHTTTIESKNSNPAPSEQELPLVAPH